jgi:L-alanine-DL-glutamate epimerase-like enolase superfamily enzyme
MSKTSLTITNIECFPMQAPGRTVVVIAVDTDGGISGVGEAGLQRRPMAIAGAVESIKRVLIGADASRIEHLWQTVFRGGFYPADRVIGSTLAAIDQALWDIKGKALDVPVYELLGGRCRDRIECYPHLPKSSLTDPAGDDRSALDELVAGCRAAVADGWRFVRLAPLDREGVFESGASVRQLLRRIAAVREGLGPDVEILVDLHTRVDPVEAIWFCRAVEPYRPYFIEDPFRSENPEPYRRLRQQTSVPIAAGEQFANKWDFQLLIEQELIDYARIDLCIATGLTEAKKIAGWAETHYIDVVPHNPLGPVSTAVGVQLAMAIPNFAVQELPWVPGTMLPDVFPRQPRFENGCFLPPTDPGLGIAFDREAARTHPFEFTEPPHFRRRDGSFTNQ